MKNLTVLLFALLAVTFSFAQQSIPFQTGKLSEVEQVAAIKGVPFVIYLKGNACDEKCDKMDETYRNDEVVEYVNAHYIIYKTDIESEEGKKIAAAHDVSSVPAILFMSHDGNLNEKVEWFLDTKDYLFMSKRFDNKSASPQN